MEVIIEPYRGFELIVEGEYSKAENDSGIGAYFTIERIELGNVPNNDISDFMEWCGSKGNKVLESIEELVLNSLK